MHGTYASPRWRVDWIKVKSERSISADFRRGAGQQLAAQDSGSARKAGPVSGKPEARIAHHLDHPLALESDKATLDVPSSRSGVAHGVSGCPTGTYSALGWARSW